MKAYQFYHIYPLGMLNKLGKNSSKQSNEGNLKDIEDFIDHFKEMSINGLYIGPIFESVFHGYDTIDYRKIDSRLGDNAMFQSFVEQCHQKDIDVIVDCVFNHVSREFFAFKDLLKNKEDSIYRHWFYTHFDSNNGHNDGFAYDTWDGHENLVKLNLKNEEVGNYLIDVAKGWLSEFKIDGLRLDAADVMDRDFIRKLNGELKIINPNMFIVGEMVHGDYMNLIEETGIDSVTNYECYKGLYSSLNDENYFEIAHSFKRLMSQEGLLKNKYLYNFLDNHDVNRIASQLKEERYLYPIYIMMYTMKGYTSLYYKSELGVRGKRDNTSDQALRPSYKSEEIEDNNPLLLTIKKLSQIRRKYDLLTFGDYEEVVVSHKLIVYRRFRDDQSLLCIINASNESQVIDKAILAHWKHVYNLTAYDLLNQEWIEKDTHFTIHPNWGAILH
jgi:glycosidase